MMRHGIDLCAEARIARLWERQGLAFARHILTTDELAILFELSPGKQVRFLSKSFSLKEAVAKALGTGIWHAGVNFHDINLRFPKGGEPELELRAAAAARARKLGVEAWNLSLSHERGLILASCLLYGREAAEG